MPIIVTDNIERECLNLITLFRDTKYIKEILLKNYSNLSQSKQKSLPGKIKSLVSQGIDFLNETDEKIITAPLTLFYSLYNFAKAIFYVKYPNEAIANSHGLSLINESAEKADEVGAVSVQVSEKGTFPNLVKVTGDSICKSDSLQVKNIFAVIPELYEVYALRYMQEPDVFLLRGTKGIPYSYEVLHQTKDWFATKDFSLVQANYLFVNNGPWYTTVTRVEACTEEHFEKVTYRDVYGNLYLTCGIEHGTERCKLSRIAALYLSYYCFGMLARYYPEKWMQFCDEADATIIRKLIVHSRKDMLVEVLRLLSGEDFCFETKLQLKENELDIRELWKKLEHEIRLQKRISGKSPLKDLL